MELELIYDKLREKTVKVAGRSMISPRDFDYLASRILDATRSYIAPITLKRFWGYVDGNKPKRPFRNTLNVLSQYVGYGDWDCFVKSFTSPAEVQSDFLPNSCLRTVSLNRSDRVQLTWHPDRCVTISYEGMGMFKVTESINSKLSVGDTFLCECFIDGEPLQLHCLVHEGQQPTNYVCGKVNGIKFRVLNTTVL